MNRTKIVVPTTLTDLPVPHFDDEATIVSARQVVPIARAKIIERSRAALWIFFILLGAAVFGAAGAIGVNYYESRHRVAVVSTPQSENSQRPQSSSQTQSEAPLNSTGPAGGGAALSEAASTEGQNSQMQNQTNDSSAIVSAKEPERQVTQTKPDSPASNGSSSDPSRLVRKRRVHPVGQANDVNQPQAEKPAKNKRGAGRIQEIFEGPNPP